MMMMTRRGMRVLLKNLSRFEYESVQHKIQKWNNGGGSFCRTACIYPTAFVEFGATVRSNSVPSTDVHIGSGTVVGSDVSVAQSTKIGLEDESERHVFQRWNNGGGSFHRMACIDPTAFIEFGAIIHSNSVVSANVHIGSGTVVGPAVSIGQSTKIGYNVCLSNCTIGDSSIIHNGVCVGQDGFGFFVDEHGNMNKKPQTKVVIVGNHVEIGANSCIDRGSWRNTVIGDCSKIDNLVQVGHNVVIGKSCMLCGQVGISGSVTLGDYVTLGGRVAVCDHVSIVSKVRVAGNGCVTKPIKKAGDYGGFPAVPIHEWRRQVARHRTRNDTAREGCRGHVVVEPKQEDSD